MTDQTVDPLARAVHPTEWAIVLSDWKRSNAWVTVHMRGGASLGPGRVNRLPGKALDSAELHDPGAYDRHEKRWTFDLGEVAAITAEARR